MNPFQFLRFFTYFPLRSDGDGFRQRENHIVSLSFLYPSNKPEKAQDIRNTIFVITCFLHDRHLRGAVYLFLVLLIKEVGIDLP